MKLENCDEFALNLCTWCLRHPDLSGDLDIRTLRLFLLHRLGSITRLQEEVSWFCMLSQVALSRHIILIMLTFSV